MIEEVLVVVFWVIYLNTGFVIMISFANFEHSPLSFIGMKNMIPDYTSEWYTVMGPQIIQTMLFNSVTP